MKRDVKTKTAVAATLLGLLLAAGTAGVARAEDDGDNPNAKPVKKPSANWTKTPRKPQLDVKN